MVKISNTEVDGFTVEENSFNREFVYTDFMPLSGSILSVSKNRVGCSSYLAYASTTDCNNHDKFFEALEFVETLGMNAKIAVSSSFEDHKQYNEVRSLADRLEQYETKIVPSLYDGVSNWVFDETEWINLVIKSDGDNSSTVDSYLKFLAWDSQRNLGNNKPNYRLKTSALIEKIEEYSGTELVLTPHPEFIEGYSAKNKFEKLNNSGYAKAIVQKGGSSFTYDDDLEVKARTLVLGINNDLEKARVIFNWIRNNINYRESEGNYRGALQTYQDRQGVCGESAALQVTMERLVGNTSFLTKVEDNHACAAHFKPNGEVVLIDTTIDKGFDVKYKKFEILSDEHSFVYKK